MKPYNKPKSENNIGASLAPQKWNRTRTPNYCNPAAHARRGLIITTCTVYISGRSNRHFLMQGSSTQAPQPTSLTSLQPAKEAPHLCTAFPRSREGLFHSTGICKNGGMDKAATVFYKWLPAHCAEVTPALQHNNGVALHSTEFRLAETSSPVPARFSYQEVTACVQKPHPGLDGQRGLSWTLTLHTIVNSSKSRMILLLTTSNKTCIYRQCICVNIVLYCL